MDQETLSKLVNTMTAIDERLRRIESVPVSVGKAPSGDLSIAAIANKLSELSSRIDDLDSEQARADPDVVSEPRIVEPEAGDLAGCGAMCEFCGGQAVTCCRECNKMLCRLCQGSSEHLECHFDD
jgi:hypothetical protein